MTRSNVGEFPQAHRGWVEHAVKDGQAQHDDRWSESIAVGSVAFIDKVKSELGFKAAHREVEVVEADGSYTLRKPAEAYGLNFGAENELLTHQNTFRWEETVDEVRT